MSHQFSVLPYESEEALLSNCPGIDEDEHIKEQNCQLRPGLQDCSEDVCRERVVSYCSRSLFTREFYILLSVNIRIDLCILPATQTIDLTFSPSKRKTPLYSVTPHPPEALFSGTSTFVLFHSIFTWIEKSAPKIQNRALYPASFIRGKIRILDLRRETAAVRLAGANHQISRARFCSSGRRSSSTFTAAAASDRVSKPAEPILYLCFKEIIKSANYVVRRVGLKDGEDDAPAEVATVEAYKAFENDMMEFSDTKCPTTLGSQIIIPVNSGKGCREICWTDTAKRPMKLQVSSDDHCSLWKLRDEIKMGEVKYVSLPKYDIRDVKIGVMGGELYSLDMYNKQLFKMYPSFNELLDPCFNQFVVVNSKSDIVSSYRKVFSEDLGFLDAIFFSESKKILARSKYNGTYCFDASNPKNGWREVNYQFLKCFSSKQALVIHNYHPDIGHFNLVFYTPIRETIEDFYEDPLFVKVLFVSDACDFARPIEHFIELPKQYLHYPSHLKNIFVHLGAQKFGIIFHDNKLAVDSNNKRGNGDVFLLTYEYDTIVDPPSAEDKSRPNVDIKTRLLEIRVFTYQTIEKLRSADYGEVDLIGASFIRQSSI